MLGLIICSVFFIGGVNGNAPEWYFLPGTKLGGNLITGGNPLPVTLSLKLDSNQQGTVCIFGLIDGKYLKMVKVRVTSESTYTWIATRYAEGYDSGCAIQSTFSETCFESTKNTKATSDIYPVKLWVTKFPGGAAFTKVFKGECEGKEIRMYAGNGDNPGTAQQQAERCSLACVTGKKPLAGSWVDFVARGFTVQKGTGRCYCESENSFTCKRSTKYHYDRYDWGVVYKKVFTGECAGKELLMYANRAQNPGKTAREREYECSKACRSKQKPQSGSWIGFSAKGFIVKPEEGRCFCEADDSSKCKQQDNNEGYNRYDWESSVVPGFTKVFSGECTNGKEVRMYDGGAYGDNPGTPEEQASRCSEACATMKEPKTADFEPRGFIVSANGRCWCETADSSDCTRETGNGYDRYDWHGRKDCPSGYTQQMPICADVNECISNKIGNAGNGFKCSKWRECVNTEGGASCRDSCKNFDLETWGDKLCTSFSPYHWRNQGAAVIMKDLNYNTEEGFDWSVKMSFSPRVGGLAAGVATVTVVSLLV